MRLLNQVLTAAITLFIFLFPLHISAKTFYQFEPATEEEKQARILFEPLVKDMIEVLNSEVPIKQDVTIVIGGDDGPLFDPQENKIYFPYSFFFFISDTFENEELAIEETTFDETVMNIFVHVLLHEYAHAYFANWDVPLLGKEEDAADVFATLLMLNVFDDPDMAYIAVDFYALLDTKTETIADLDLWGEHSLDYQRYTQSLCLIYGSDPEKYAFIMDKELKGIERDTFCIEEFHLKNYNLGKIILSNQ
ncbi:DUF4344 domain-containing metallopeptidase [Enterovibrio makurazakiensis]|uniref:DUF4344 domain-containing metallopeptidase n=1 Tax=Enterovibrio makurazakiensis TaxID=2910232 RepID=UPI003D21497D